jgi:pyruvate/2-oxoglutarate dehydrogenase complex dihydrolipoamide dehydrogenase (E3) component
VSGLSRSSAAATRQGDLVARQALLGENFRWDRISVPKALFTDPQLAEIGISEAEATRRHRNRIRIVQQSFATNGRGIVAHEDDGVAKLICDVGGRILGASIAGPGAAELIGLVALAMNKGMTLRDLASFDAPFPTHSAILRELADTFAREGTDGRARRRLALGRFLR